MPRVFSERAALPKVTRTSLLRMARDPR